MMMRLDRYARVLSAAMMLTIGSGTVTAGIFDLIKFSGKKTDKVTVARAQEPNPAPPAPLNVGEDPAYAQPIQPPAGTTTDPSTMPPSIAYPSMDYAPQYSGFSDGSCGHACIGCRGPNSLCEYFQFSSAKSSRRLSGQSYYCDSYPLFGPRYGHYTTCWRRMPEDCRCPIFIPPRKSATISDPSPIDTSEPAIPPAPQALRLR